MVEIEVEYTIKYMEVLRHLGKNIPKLDEQMCHIIASGMFNGVFEIVIHDMPQGQSSALCGSAAGLLHSRMAEINGAVSPIFSA